MIEVVVEQPASHMHMHMHMVEPRTPPVPSALLPGAQQTGGWVGGWQRPRAPLVGLGLEGPGPRPGRPPCRAAPYDLARCSSGVRQTVAGMADASGWKASTRARSSGGRRWHIMLSTAPPRASPPAAASARACVREATRDNRAVHTTDMHLHCAYTVDKLCRALCRALQVPASSRWAAPPGPPCLAWQAPRPASAG